MEHKIQYHTVQINGLNIFTVKQELPARLSYYCCMVSRLPAICIVN